MKDTREFMVTISKTVQERQYEPITVSFTTKGTCPTDQYEKEQDAAYQQLKQKIQAVFAPQTKERESLLDTALKQARTEWL